jgi:choice-of-anchor A domain-containing protein
VDQSSFGAVSSKTISLNTISQGVSILNKRASQGSPIDFQSAEGELKNLSSRLNGMTVNGTIIDYYEKLIFTGSDDSLNVFSVSSDEIQNAHTLDMGVLFPFFEINRAVSLLSVTALLLYSL